jgi:hypothetical protein
MTKIDIIQSDLVRQADELRAMGEWVLDREGRPSCGRRPDPVPANEHHRIAVRDQKPDNRVFFYNWKGKLGQDICMQASESRTRSVGRLTCVAQNFMDDLRRYMLIRLRPELASRQVISRAELLNVRFVDNCIYSHATARFNYTTYDLQRDYDMINTNGDKNAVMIHVPNSGTNHPWRYARVLGVYHATVYEGDDKADTFPFLWVRYLETDTSYAFGPEARRLERVRYVQGSGDDAFGCVDPAHIIRAVYLAPAVHYGHHNNGLGPSYAHDFEVDAMDWRYFYVNM